MSLAVRIAAVLSVNTDEAGDLSAEAGTDDFCSSSGRQFILSIARHGFDRVGSTDMKVLT